MTVDERIHILIVEDELILAMDLGDSLENESYHVVGIVSNGRRALELFQQQRVDLLLCDINLKGDWNGFETVRHLTALRPVPVLYLTALSDRGTLEQALHDYSAAFLNKPFQLKSLRTAIDGIMYRFHTHKTSVSTSVPTPAAPI